MLDTEDERVAFIDAEELAEVVCFIVVLEVCV